jgi:SAM-dependent methyltransferase
MPLKHFDSVTAIPYPLAMPTWTAETADWYADNYGEYPTNRLGTDAIDFADAKTVVDVGCGTGAALRHLSTTHPELELIGIDPVPRMVDIARQRVAEHQLAACIDFRIGPAEDIPVDDDVADIVLAFDSFDHWQDRSLALAEIRRILRPDGRLVVLKDAGAPGGAHARSRLQQTTTQAGFTLLSQTDLVEGDVKCAIWVFSCPATAEPALPMPN